MHATRPATGGFPFLAKGRAVAYSSLFSVYAKSFAFAPANGRGFRRIKSAGGPCNQGETAEQTGCIPASGEGSKKPKATKRPSQRDASSGKESKDQLPPVKTPKVNFKYAGRDFQNTKPAAVWSKFFGHDIDLGVLAAAVNGIDGAEVELFLDNESGHLSTRYEFDGVKAARTFEIVNGKLVVRNNSFFIEKDSPYKGKGAALFANQVAALQELGVDRIETDAGGSSKDQQNGYYTWPRLGFDGTIDEDVFAAMPGSLRKQFGSKRNVRSLLMLPGGIEFWREHGERVRDAKFDLKTGSESLRILTAYLEERQKR